MILYEQRRGAHSRGRLCYTRMVFATKTFSLVFIALMQTGRGFAQQPSGPPPEPAIVEGMVINAQNSRSVPRAQVVLRRIRGPQASKSARTDGNGRFIFKNVDPGTYRLSAERQGFFSDSHKRGFEPMFEVASGAHVKDMPVRLMPTSVIAGSVVDEYNDPVQNVEVRALSVHVRLGQISLAPEAAARTDDRGEYRIPGLRPGKYYVAAEYKPNNYLPEVTLQGFDAGASARRFTLIRGADGNMQMAEVKNNVEDTPESTFTYPPLFYPNTGDFLQAQRLPVNPGDEVHANFVFLAMPSVSIKGRVVNGLTGQPAVGATVSAYWTEYLESAGVPAVVSPKDGTFTVRGVSPGAYTLRASFADGRDNFADQRTVQVGNEGLQNVQMAGLPDFSASGRVTVESVKHDDKVNLVAVDFIAEGAAPRVHATMNRGGFTFTAQLHPQSHYHVNVPGLPEDYYLKSVLVSGHEIPKDDVVVSGTRGEIELVISPSGGHVEGTLFDQKEQPTHGSVLLVPDVSNPGPPELFHRASADTQGKFSLRGISPGSYKLIAFESVDLDEEIHQPDFLSSFANQGQNIIVDESGVYIVAVKMIVTAESNQ